MRLKPISIDKYILINDKVCVELLLIFNLDELDE